jgi:hypothetical protein
MAAAVASRRPRAGASSGQAEELERLSRLHQSGALSDDEYAAAKAKALSS